MAAHQIDGWGRRIVADRVNFAVIQRTWGPRRLAINQIRGDLILVYWGLVAIAVFVDEFPGSRTGDGGMGGARDQPVAPRDINVTRVEIFSAAAPVVDRRDCWSSAEADDVVDKMHGG